MKASQPFGELTKAKILVIGHDPRLQSSQAEAEYAFFLDYLLRPRPGRRSEARKYGLANALLDYISDLAGQEIPLQDIYVTNLCNEFLPPTQGRGIVLIPDHHAAKGVEDLCQVISQSRLRLIIPLSLQVAYHLARLGFFDENNERLQNFIRQAHPIPAKAGQGVYHPAGSRPFLDICGWRLHHHGIPVVPVLHVKHWPLPARMERYVEPMKHAAQEINSVLSKTGGAQRN